MAHNINHEPQVHCVHEPITGTWQFVVADATSKRAVVIDPVMDFDKANRTVSLSSAESILSLITEKGYLVERLLETHVHADHLSASHYLKMRLSKMQSFQPKIGIGAGISQIQTNLAARYNISQQQLQGSFDDVFDEGDEFLIGSHRARVLSLPGHTPDHIGYLVGSNAFVGDSIFSPELGSARADFPGGSAAALWASMQSLLSLPDDVRLYTGHDYPQAGVNEGQAKAFATVAQHRMENKHAGAESTKEEFIKWREDRDRGLAEPKLMHESLQVNMLGGRFPRHGNETKGMLTLPVNIPGSFVE